MHWGTFDEVMQTRVVLTGVAHGLLHMDCIKQIIRQLNLPTARTAIVISLDSYLHDTTKGRVGTNRFILYLT
jgi:hypothetical protein